MNKETELKPCPFCGGKARLITYDTCTCVYYVKCDSASCGIKPVTWIYTTGEEAVEAWNKMVDDEYAEGICRMSDLKKYVIEKEGYSTIIVNLTEREARVIEKFLDWACLDDNFYIESVEEYEADEWGSDGTNIVALHV